VNGRQVLADLSAEFTNSDMQQRAAHVSHRARVGMFACPAFALERPQRRTNRETAARMFVGESTVKTHVRSHCSDCTSTTCGTLSADRGTAVVMQWLTPPSCALYSGL
jgi:hypothetical protein